jgi:hypothetical protein
MPTKMPTRSGNGGGYRRTRLFSCSLHRVRSYVRQDSPWTGRYLVVPGLIVIVMEMVNIWRAMTEIERRKAGAQRL